MERPSPIYIDECFAGIQQVRVGVETSGKPSSKVPAGSCRELPGLSGAVGHPTREAF